MDKNHMMSAGCLLIFVHILQIASGNMEQPLVQSVIYSGYEPQNLSLASYTTQSIAVHWNSPGNFVFRYNINWNCENCGVCNGYTVVNNSVHSYNITSLSPAVECTITVATTIQANTTTYPSSLTQYTSPNRPGAGEDSDSTATTITKQVFLRETPITVHAFYTNMEDSTKGNQSSEHPANVFESKLILTDLTPGSNYYVNFYAVRGNGWSVPRAFTKNTKLAPAMNLSTFNVTERSLSADWDLAGYNIDFWSVECKSQSNTYKSGNINMTTFTFDNLQPGTRHEVSVTSHSSVPLFQNVVSQAKYDMTVPMPPVNVSSQSLNESAVYISWELPEKSFTGFMVHYYPNDGNPPSPVTLPETAADVVILELTGDSDYNVTIYSVSEDTGLLKTSEEQMFEQCTNPYAPGEIFELNLTANTMTFGWNNTARSPEAHNVSLTPSEATMVIGNVTDEDNDTFSVEVTGLRPGRRYDVAVRVFSCDGFSLPSEKMIRTVVIPPGAPGNLTAVEVGGHTIDVKWKEPVEPNGDIQYYIVHLQRAESGERDLLNTTGPVPQLHITNLTAVTKYLIAVTAVNEEGPGALSNNITVWTDESLPESVVDLKVEQDTSRSLNVSWFTPAVTNGLIVQYQVNATDSTGKYCVTVVFMCSDCLPEVTTNQPLPSTSEADLISVQSVVVNDDVVLPYEHEEVSIDNNDIKSNSACVTIKETYKSEQMSFDYQLANLIPYNNYTVTVTAATSKGFGRSASAANETLQDVPDGPPTTITVTNQTWNSLNISWQPPEFPNGIITKYDIRIEETSTSRIISNSTLQHTVIVSDLLHYEEYVIRLSASTKIGNGSWSSPVIARTQEGVPSPVLNLTSSSPNSTAINLHWSEPLLPNGIIRLYVIRYNGSELTVSADSTSAVIAGLEKWTVYTFSVTALNLNYEGNVTMTTQQTQEDTPEMPIGFNTTFYNASTICLSWQPPNKPNGILLGYRLLRNTSGEITVDYLGIEETQGCAHALSYWTQYQFRIAANTSKGYGQEAVVDRRTDEYYPGQVASVNITCTPTNDSIQLKWRPPAQPNGDILKYTVTYQQVRKLQDDDDLSPRQVDFTRVSGDVVDLLPYREYNFTVFAHTRIGTGLPSEAVLCSTFVGAPKLLRGVFAEPTSPYDVSVTWIKPWLKTGPTNYTLEVVDIDENPNILKRTYTITGFDKESQSVDGLDPYWRYKFEVKVKTSAGTSTLENVTRTLEATSGPVNAFNISTISGVHTAVNAAWTIPDRKQRRGRISQYRIEYNGVQSDGFGNGSDQRFVVHYVSNPDQPPEAYSAVLPVVAEFTYTFRIQAKTGAGYGENATYSNVFTPSGPPPSYNTSSDGSFAGEAPDQSEVTDNSTQIKVVLKRTFFANNNHGQVRRIGLIIAEETDNLKADPTFQGSAAEYEKNFGTKYTAWSKAYDEKVTPPYRLTDDVWSDRKLIEINTKRKRRAVEMTEIIGQAGDCTGLNPDSYCNGKLKPSTNYRIRGFSCTDYGCTETPYSDLIKTARSVGGPSNPGNQGSSNLAAIIGGSLGGVVAVILIVIIVILLVTRRRTSSTGEGGTSQGLIKGGGRRGSKEVVHNPTFADEGDEPRSRPIKLKEFVEKMKKAKENANYFRDEHGTIQDLSPNLPKVASIAICNTPKNRYLNIFAFDHSRVKLAVVDGVDGSDYINANYIPGYNKTQEYIAAQGPNETTLPDFWRMIWEQNISIVVMLTRPVESGKVKCSQYWPDFLEQPQAHGELEVSKLDDETHADYVIRNLQVKKSSDEENTDSHKVRQYCFLGWNDFQAPRETGPLIKFVRFIRNEISTSKGPVLVHCSAGVGRTGTFIVLDTLLQQMKETDHVDIFGLVLRLREYRNSMVQSVAQYRFIHDCVVDILQESTQQTSDISPVSSDSVHISMPNGDHKTSSSREVFIMNPMHKKEEDSESDL